MKKRGFLLMLLVLALTLTVAVAVAETAECEHANTHWEHDTLTHWQVCDDCGETISGPDGHYSSCVDPDACMECGATDVEMSMVDTHGDFSWEYDQTSHTSICSLCGEAVFTAPHEISCLDDPNSNVCSACGAEGVEISIVSHVWSTDLQYNETEHWYVCYDCGEVLLREPHQGSCQNPERGACEICGATDVTLGSITHGELRAEYNDAHHWFVCEVCGETTGYDVHHVWCYAPNDTTCVECGMEHVTNAELLHGRRTFACDKTEHWFICMDCNQEIERGPHYRVCTETRTDFCSQCLMVGATVSEIHHEHTTMQHDQDTHWTVCNDCGETIQQPEKHFTEAGDPEGVCSVCGAAYTSTPEPTDEPEPTNTPEPTDTPEPSDTPTTPPTDLVAIESVTVSGDLKVGSTLTATINATGATAYSFWVYDTDNVLIEEAYMTSSNTLTFTAPKPGGYIVFAAATNGALTATANSGWFVVAGDQVVINSLTVTGTQEVGSAITVTVESSTATAYSYWLYDGQATLLEEVYMTSSNTYTFTPEKPGIYNVFVAVTDGATGAQANTGWFPVKGESVVINKLTITGDKKVGSPLTVTVNATGATGFSYWCYDATGALLEEVYMVTTSSYTFTPETAGGYNVFVAVTDGVSSAQANTGWFLVE